MEFKIGDVILTNVDKKGMFGDLGDIFIPKGSEGYVCEVYGSGLVLVEFSLIESHPACVLEYPGTELLLKEKTDLIF